MISPDDANAANERMAEMTRWWWKLVSGLPGMTPDLASNIVAEMLGKEHDLIWQVLLSHERAPWEDDDG